MKPVLKYKITRDSVFDEPFGVKITLTDGDDDNLVIVSEWQIGTKDVGHEIKIKNAMLNTDEVLKLADMLRIAAGVAREAEGYHSFDADELIESFDEFQEDMQYAADWEAKRISE